MYTSDIVYMIFLLCKILSGPHEHIFGKSEKNYESWIKIISESYFK